MFLNVKKVCGLWRLLELEVYLLSFCTCRSMGRKRHPALVCEMNYGLPKKK